MSDRVNNINISINGSLAGKKKQIKKYSRSYMVEEDNNVEYIENKDNNNEEDDIPPKLIENSDDESDDDSIGDPTWNSPTSEEDEEDEEDEEFSSCKSGVNSGICLLFM